MVQTYVNIEDAPIETVYLFPKEADQVFSGMEVEFTLQDGTKRTLVTRVDERKQVETKYEEAVAQGKTAAVVMFSRSQSSMMRIVIGNFPPHSSAKVTVKFSQKLDLEDMSYRLAIPCSYVPRYMGDIQSYINNGAMF